MTEATNVEETQPEGANADQANVSEGKAKSIADAPPSSQELLEIRKELQLTRSELKGLQGRQDKEQNEIQRFMEDVKAQMAKGLSFDEAEQAVNKSREASLKDDLLFKMAEKLGVLGDSPQNTAGNGSNAANEVAKVFDKYGISANDPEAVPLLDLRGVDLIDGVASLAIKRAKQTPLDASEASSISGKSAPAATPEALKSEYISKMNAARGNRKQIETLKAQYKDKGVDIYSIDFS
jgi:hypothetical protein